MLRHFKCSGTRCRPPESYITITVTNAVKPWINYKVCSRWYYYLTYLGPFGYSLTYLGTFGYSLTYLDTFVIAMRLPSNKNYFHHVIKKKNDISTFFPVLEQIPTTSHISTEWIHRNKNDLTLKLRAQIHCFCNQKSKELQKASSVQVGVTQCTNFHGNFFCTRWASHRAQTSIKLDHDRC